jgi:hypothetical protein
MKKKIEKIEKDDLRVDVYNDAEMVELGIRPRPLEPRDPKVWTKSYTDKKNARLVRHHLKHAFDYMNWSAPTKSIPIPGTLIVIIKGHKNFSEKLKNGKTFYKTVFSHKCIQSDIPNILNKYIIRSKDKAPTNLIVKYKWNGKEYSYGELPYWYGR